MPGKIKINVKRNEKLKILKIDPNDVTSLLNKT